MRRKEAATLCRRVIFRFRKPISISKLTSADVQLCGDVLALLYRGNLKMFKLSLRNSVAFPIRGVQIPVDGSNFFLTKYKTSRILVVSIKGDSMELRVIDNPLIYSKTLKTKELTPRTVDLSEEPTHSESVCYTSKYVVDRGSMLIHPQNGNLIHAFAVVSPKDPRVVTIYHIRRGVFLEASLLDPVVIRLDEDLVMASISKKHIYILVRRDGTSHVLMFSIRDGRLLHTIRVRAEKSTWIPAGLSVNEFGPPKILVLYTTVKADVRWHTYIDVEVYLQNKTFDQGFYSSMVPYFSNFNLRRISGFSRSIEKPREHEFLRVQDAYVTATSIYLVLPNSTRIVDISCQFSFSRFRIDRSLVLYSNSSSMVLISGSEIFYSYMGLPNSGKEATRVGLMRDLIMEQERSAVLVSSQLGRLIADRWKLKNEAVKENPDREMISRIRKQLVDMQDADGWKEAPQLSAESVSQSGSDVEPLHKSIMNRIKWKSSTTAEPKSIVDRIKWKPSTTEEPKSIMDIIKWRAAKHQKSEEEESESELLDDYSRSTEIPDSILDDAVNSIFESESPSSKVYELVTEHGIDNPMEALRQHARKMILRRDESVLPKLELLGMDWREEMLDLYYESTDREFWVWVAEVLQFDGKAREYIRHGKYLEYLTITGRILTEISRADFFRIVFVGFLFSSDDGESCPAGVTHDVKDVVYRVYRAAILADLEIQRHFEVVWPVLIKDDVFFSDDPERVRDLADKVQSDLKLLYKGLKPRPSTIVPLPPVPSIYKLSYECDLCNLSSIFYNESIGPTTIRNPYHIVNSKFRIRKSTEVSQYERIRLAVNKRLKPKNISFTDWEAPSGQRLAQQVQRISKRRYLLLTLEKFSPFDIFDKYPTVDTKIEFLHHQSFHYGPYYSHMLEGLRRMMIRDYKGAMREFSSVKPKVEHLWRVYAGLEAVGMDAQLKFVSMFASGPGLEMIREQEGGNDFRVLSRCARFVSKFSVRSIMQAIEALCLISKYDLALDIVRNEGMDVTYVLERTIDSKIRNLQSSNIPIYKNLKFFRESFWADIFDICRQEGKLESLKPFLTQSYRRFRKYSTLPEDISFIKTLDETLCDPDAFLFDRTLVEFYFTRGDIGEYIKSLEESPYTRRNYARLNVYYYLVGKPLITPDLESGILGYIEALKELKENFSSWYGNRVTGDHSQVPKAFENVQIDMHSQRKDVINLLASTLLDIFGNGHPSFSYERFQRDLLEIFLFGDDESVIPFVQRSLQILSRMPLSDYSSGYIAMLFELGFKFSRNLSDLLLFEKTFKDRFRSLLSDGNLMYVMEVLNFIGRYRETWSILKKVLLGRRYVSKFDMYIKTSESSGRFRQLLDIIVSRVFESGFLKQRDIISISLRLGLQAGDYYYTEGQKEMFGRRNIARGALREALKYYHKSNSVLKIDKCLLDLHFLNILDHFEIRREYQIQTLLEGRDFPLERLSLHELLVLVHYSLDNDESRIPTLSSILALLLQKYHNTGTEVLDLARGISELFPENFEFLKAVFSASFPDGDTDEESGDSDLEKTLLQFIETIMEIWPSKLLPVLVFGLNFSGISLEEYLEPDLKYLLELVDDVGIEKVVEWALGKVR